MSNQTELWWDMPPQKAANRIWQHLVSITDNNIRLNRLRSHSQLAWLYERDGIDGFGFGAWGNAANESSPFANQNYYGYGEGNFRVSLNYIKSRIDTVAARLFREIPNVEIAPYNATYEAGFAARAMTDALMGTMNTPLAKRQIRKPGRDGLLQGFGAVMPVVRDGMVTFERIQYRQLWWDPADAQFGDPRSMHYWTRTSKSLLLADIESWSFESEKDKNELIDSVKLLDPATPWGPLESQQGYLTPYERELTGSGGMAANTYGNDLVHVLYSWHLPGSKHTKDGKYIISAHGGGAGTNKGSLILFDGPYERRKFPFSYWNSFENNEGIDGLGLGQTMRSPQYQVDRLWAKMERESDTFNHTKCLLFGSKGSQVKQSLAAPGMTFLTMPERFAGPQGRTFEIITPSAINGQDVDLLNQVISLADQFHGINQVLAQGGTSLKGDPSGIAMHEEDDRQSDRFADIEERWDSFLLQVASDTLFALESEAKKDKEFKVHFFGKDGDRFEKWSELMLPTADYSLRFEPTGTLGRRKAGQITKAFQMAQMGAAAAEAAFAEVGTFADVRRLTENEQAGWRLVEWQLAGLSIEGRSEGSYLSYMPTDDVPLETAIKLGTSTLQLAIRRGANDKTLDRLRTYVDTATKLIEKNQPQAQPPLLEEPLPGGDITQPASPVLPTPDLPQ